MSTTLEINKDHSIEQSHGMRKKKILVIDDEAKFTSIVKLTLEMKDKYEVFVENDSWMAISTARKCLPDIILMDVIMAEPDGIEVEAQFKADPTLKHIPIIFLTAVVRKKDINEFHGLIGGQFFIAKPISAYDLIQAIEEHVRT
jgi:CheY-like chemotaxis protein